MPTAIDPNNARGSEPDQGCKEKELQSKGQRRLHAEAEVARDLACDHIGISLEWHTSCSYLAQYRDVDEMLENHRNQA
jgi:hypothetical protein